MLRVVVSQPGDMGAGSAADEWLGKPPPQSVIYFDGELRPLLLQKWAAQLGEPSESAVLSRDDYLFRMV